MAAKLREKISCHYSISLLAISNGSAGGKSRVTEKGGNGLAFEGSLHELAKEMEGVLSL